MLSRTGYTRLHSPHFRLSPFSFWTRGFLQTGQTRMSRRSCGIMGSILRQPEAPLVAITNSAQFQGLTMVFTASWKCDESRVTKLKP